MATKIGIILQNANYLAKKMQKKSNNLVQYREQCLVLDRFNSWEMGRENHRETAAS